MNTQNMCMNYNFCLSFFYMILYYVKDLILCTLRHAKKQSQYDVSYVSIKGLLLDVKKRCSHVFIGTEEFLW